MNEETRRKDIIEACRTKLAEYPEVFDMAPIDQTRVLHMAAEAASKIIDEVNIDMDAGVIPRDEVECFSDLHDWVDANMYGIDEDEEIEMGEEFIMILNVAQCVAEQFLF